MKIFYIYCDLDCPEAADGYIAIYANDLWSALEEFEQDYGSVDIISAIHVE